MSHAVQPHLERKERGSGEKVRGGEKRERERGGGRCPNGEKIDIPGEKVRGSGVGTVRGGGEKSERWREKREGVGVRLERKLIYLEGK